MIRSTVTITHTALDDVVGVYSSDRFAFFHEEVDESTYVGGGSAADCVLLAVGELERLFRALGVPVALSVTTLDQTAGDRLP